MSEAEKGWARSAATLVLAVLAVVSVAACGDGGGSSPAPAGPTVRDSAGVTIVENAGPTWTEGEGWRVAPEPELRIGTLEGPDETRFFRLQGVRLRSDGTLLVLDGGNHRLLAFGSDGAFRWSQGRRGEGPGEYTQPTVLLLLEGDTAVVSNRGSWRMTMVGPEGDLVRTVDPERMEGSFRSDPIGEVVPGLLVGSGGAAFDFDEVTNGRMERRPERFYLLDVEGEMRDTLPTLPGREMWMVADGASVSIFGIPLARGAHLATGAGFTVGGVSERPRWEIRDETGALKRVVEVTLPERPVTAAEWTRALEAQIPEGADDGQRTGMRRVFEAVPQAEAWPVFSQLKLDDRGYLWVQRYPAPWDDAGPRSWWVFDPEGTLLGTVETPAGFTLDQVRGDRLAGRWEDEFGVEQARVYRLEGRSGS